MSAFLSSQFTILYYPDPIVVLDLETSGLSAEEDSIIEVAACLLKGGEIVDRFSSLVHFEGELVEAVECLTGITANDLKEAPAWADLQPQLQAFIGTYPIVGHNIAFDIGFLVQNGIVIEQIMFDTYELAGMLLSKPRSYSLEALTHDFDIAHRDKHRALSDVEATADLFTILWEKATTIDAGQLENIVELLRNSNSQHHSFFQQALNCNQVVSRDTGDLIETIDQPPIQDWWHDAHSPYFDFEQRKKESLQNFQNTLAGHLATSANLVLEIDSCEPKDELLALPFFKAIEPSLLIIDDPVEIAGWRDFAKKYDALNPAGIIFGEYHNNDHYICGERLEAFLKSKQEITSEEAQLVVKIWLWLERTEQGLVSEIGFVRNEYPLFQTFFKAYPSCLHHQDCYLKAARDKAERAQVLVIQTRTLFNMDVQERAKIEQRKRVLVSGIEHYEERLRFHHDKHLHQSQLVICFEALNAALKVCIPHEDLLLQQSKSLAIEWTNYWLLLGLFMRPYIDPAYQVGKLVINEDVRIGQEFENLRLTAEGLLQKWQDFKLLIQANAQSSYTEFLEWPCLEIDQFSHTLKKFFQPASSDFSYLEQTGQLEIIVHVMSKNIGLVFQEKILNSFEQCILLSGLMGNQDDSNIDYLLYTYLEAVFLIKKSDFVIEKYLSLYPPIQDVRLMIPEDIPEPNAPSYMQALIKLVDVFVASLRGSIIAAMSSVRNNQDLHAALSLSYKKEGIHILAQGISGGKGKVLQAYERDPDSTVLLATAFFWNYAKLENTKIKAMLIQKMPFDYPDDPLLKIYTSLFSNVFEEYSLPRSLFRLKNLINVLLRSPAGPKYLLFPDVRILKKSYGKYVLGLFRKDQIIKFRSSELKHLLSAQS